MIFRPLQAIRRRESNSRILFWKSLSQKLRRVVGLCNDYARCIDKLIKSDLETSRRKNVVGMRGKTKSDGKKFMDPESRARGHSREVRVNMTNPHLLQAQPNVNSLIEPKEISAPSPFIESGDNF